MTRETLITVIVPVYNIKEYLPRCVHSITAQTYRNLEIILVDDGSTDGTGQLCEDLAKEDSRITVLHKENGGSSSARNLGLRQAKGDYVGFVDSDDYISENMYETLLKGIQEHSDENVAIAQIGRDEIDEQGNLLPNICQPPETDTFYDKEAFMRELLLHKGDCSFCTKLVRRDLFPEDAFPVGKLNEDFHLLVNLLPRVNGILSLPGQAYHVFYRIGSNSRKAEKENFSRVYADNIENADMVLGLVRQYFPKLEETAFRFGVYQRIDYLLHIPISQMTGDNDTYRAVVGYMRRNWAKSMRNSILTGKNKMYHTLFAIAPKTLRKMHRAIITRNYR